MKESTFNVIAFIITIGIIVGITAAINLIAPYWMFSLKDAPVRCINR